MSSTKQNPFALADNQNHLLAEWNAVKVEKLLTQDESSDLYEKATPIDDGGSLTCLMSNGNNSDDDHIVTFIRSRIEN
jgi:predicted glutamine amidotransferase